MAIKVYNSLSNQKEDFIPLKEGEVMMYVCGVTVYDDIHIGHARSIIVFDMVARYLRYRGFKVTHVTNFTDVDDKIINRANEEGVPPLELSARYIQRYFHEVDALGVRRADIYPKASESMDSIVKMVEQIIERGYGYSTPDGSVYFSVDRIQDYGRLTKQKLEDMVSSGRVTLDEQKRNPMDFAVWKAAKPGEIAWESPWGVGRPGWHIECSAMIREHLGDLIDIHGGGNDLIFPHHENEILQTEAAVGTSLARYWMHNGMVQFKDEKMSKSLGNFFRVRDVLEKHSRQTLRFYMLNTHYRGPLGYSEEALQEAESSLKRLWNNYRELQAYSRQATGGEHMSEVLERCRQDFTEQMDDDFNSRGALSAIFQMVRETNSAMAESRLSAEGAAAAISLLEELDQVLAILPDDKGSDDVDILMEVIIGIREELRRGKQYQAADLIRDRLKDAGFQLEDSGKGAKWKRV
ncbi:MAG: cysteine--tRNA ligase [Candidatus Methanomethylophilaceae archaeon]|nr:cysteine--tRNA ligase [Candidatus Methanomethylophilaceae archaeon]